MRHFLLICALLGSFSLLHTNVSAEEVQEEEVQEPEADDAGDMTEPADSTRENQPTASYIPSVPAPGTTQAQPGIPQTPATPSPTPTPPEDEEQPVTVTPPAPPVGAGTTDFDMVMLQGLNKVTASRQTLEASIGSVVRYGTIEIIAHKCWKSSPEDRPENAALLEVSEIKQGEAPQHIFSGWMYSSTPGLLSLEHPFYDITVISCGKATTKP